MHVEAVGQKIPGIGTKQVCSIAHLMRKKNPTCTIPVGLNYKKALYSIILQLTAWFAITNILKKWVPQSNCTHLT